jgi:hypothetical protein
MFSEKPAWFSLIDKAVKYDGHSGASHGWTMRCIDYIAKHGWENFVAKFSNPDAATKRRLRILELPYSIQEARNNLEECEENARIPPSIFYDEKDKQRTHEENYHRVVRQRINDASYKLAELVVELRALTN